MTPDIEVAYQCSPSDKCYEIIESAAWSNTQEPGADMGADMLGQAAVGGYVCLYRHEDVVFCLSRQTAWIGRVDVFVPPGVKFYDCLKAARSFLNWTIGHTEYERLEARSPERFIYILGVKAGAQLDAYIPHSYMDATGEMVAEYLVGWTRPRSMTWHQ